LIDPKLAGPRLEPVPRFAGEKKNTKQITVIVMITPQSQD